MALFLYTERDNNGRQFRFDGSTPRLPVEIDALSESLIIERRDIPASLFSEPDYGGQQFIITGAGGSNDLSQLQGNWFHKIRSIKLNSAFLKEVDSCDLEETPTWKEVVATEEASEQQGACWYSSKPLSGKPYGPFCVILSRRQCYQNYNQGDYQVLKWTAGLDCQGQTMDK